MLDDRVIIVTGGGRGLGRTMAEALLTAGGRVVITGAGRPDALAATGAAMAAAFGSGRVLTVVADVTDPAACANVVSNCIATFGRLDALINNAGRGMREISETFISQPIRFWDIEPSKWAAIFAINVNGVFHMSRAAMPHFLKQGHGRIINISTSDHTMVRRGFSPYGPSKTAVEAMSRCWAQDVAGTGVTVNVLAPGGAVDTEFVPGGGPDRRGADGNLLDPVIMGPPAVWLASEASASTNGARFLARLWDPSLPPEIAAVRARSAPARAPVIM